MNNSWWIIALTLWSVFSLASPQHPHLAWLSVRLSVAVSASDPLTNLVFSSSLIMQQKVFTSVGSGVQDRSFTSRREEKLAWVTQLSSTLNFYLFFIFFGVDIDAVLFIPQDCCSTCNNVVLNIIKMTVCVFSPVNLWRRASQSAQSPEGYTQHIWLMVRLSLHAHANHFSDWLCCSVALMASLAGAVAADSALSSLFPRRDFLYPFLYYLERWSGQVHFHSNHLWVAVKTKWNTRRRKGAEGVH